MSSENFFSGTFGFVLDVQSAEKLLHEHELETTTSFVMYYNYDAGKENVEMKGKKVFFEDPNTPMSQPRITYDGVPFIITGKPAYDCHQGTNRHAAEKQQRKIAKEDIMQRKARKSAQDSIHGTSQLRHFVFADNGTKSRTKMKFEDCDTRSQSQKEEGPSGLSLQVTSSLDSPESTVLVK